MSDDEFDFLPLRVIRECSNGKRRYDPEGKRRLIQACLRPGASIAGLALRAQVNANQLHKWIDGIDIDAVRRHPARQYHHTS